MSKSGRVVRTVAVAASVVFALANLANAQILDAPDPAQMEDAPVLGYHPVENGLEIPVDMEMGAPSSVVWTTKNTLLVFNRGPNPLLEFDENGEFLHSWGQGE